MDRDPFCVSALVNDSVFANTLIDTGCLSYSLCDPRFAKKNNLTLLKIKPRTVTGVDGKVTAVTDEVAVMDIDLDRYSES